MKKYFVVTDVHGFFNELQLALNNTGFDINNKEHIFVSCGDLLDRGSQPMECLNFVNNLPADRKILITGNHEELMLSMINRGFPHDNDIHNKTVETVLNLYKSMTGSTLTIFDCHAACNTVYKAFPTPTPLYEYLNSTVDYAEVGNNIFVHGWIPNNEYFPNGNWEEARWLNGMNEWVNGYTIDGKTIYCGHWHCSWGWSHLRQERKEFPHKEKKDWQKSFEPFVEKGIVAFDACTAYSGMVNCLVIKESDL